MDAAPTPSSIAEGDAGGQMPPNLWDEARSVLSLMEPAGGAQRGAAGIVHVSRRSPPRHLLFGPFLRLPEGRYRLTLTCRCGPAGSPQVPVLGVEILAQSRLQRGWQDFSASELATTVSCLFDVPPALAPQPGQDIAFEFRLTHLAAAELEITAMALQRIGPHEPSPLEPPRFRLIGRLRRSVLPRAVATLALHHPILKPGLLCDRCQPRLLLPAGRYRLDITTRPARPSHAATPALGLAVATRDDAVLAEQTISRAELPAASMLFDVPAELALESGSDVCLDLRIRRLSRHGTRIEAVDLVFVGPTPDTLPHVAIGGQARARMVIVGNCQAAQIGDLLRGDEQIRRKLEVHTHHVELSEPLQEQGLRDLERCDILLVQDISDWKRYPLQHAIPDRAMRVHFPCLRLASLWPFDAFNGPDDRQARLQDAPNFEFTYFDGMMARLRLDIPDPAARLAAYRSLAVDHVVDARRLHRLEERRLQAMDTTYGGDTGAYILGHFQREQVFYTTAHPNRAVFDRLLLTTLAKVDPKLRPRAGHGPDRLRYLQVPVHPLVAEQLGVSWAMAGAHYLYRGQQITWDEYFRRYIAHYG